MAKKEGIRRLFNNIASGYDKLNHILSLNIDKGWRRKAAGFESVEHKSLTFGICRMYICKKPYIKVAS
jgi:ubiquinone/menaquinone biosynthesis C-methylase UbiE